jgi:hypothetical protein
MPIFSLGRLGRFQITRLPSSHHSSPGEHDYLLSTPPPEYTDTAEIEAKYHAPSQAQPSECKTEQERRFVIEILAVTFNANFDMLNAAIYNMPAPYGTNTILCDSERADLLTQSELIRKVHGHFLRNAKTTIDRKDEEEICATIVQPIRNLETEPSGLWCFCLDMIGWYGEEVRSPSGTRWTCTIPGYWQANPYPYYGTEYVEQSMSSFLKVIEYMALNDEVHKVLWKAWNDARRRCGLCQLEPARLCWPVRKVYNDLRSSLWELVLSEP